MESGLWKRGACGLVVMSLFAQLAGADVELINRNQLSAFAPLDALGFSETTGRQSLSDDGRYVVFSSQARNLVPGDDNEFADIFLKDTQSGDVTLLSSPPEGVSEDRSSDAVISADGQFVAFVSEAGNLTEDDEDSTDDIFLYERQTGTLQRISFNPDSEVVSTRRSSMPSISADGRYVAFVSGRNNLIEDDTNNRDDVFVYDRVLNTFRRADLTQAGLPTATSTFVAVMSRNARYVAFASGDPNVVSDDTNSETDLFVRDLQANTTQRVTLDGNGQQITGAEYELFAVSDLGEVVFATDAALLAADSNGDEDIYLASSTPGSLELISQSAAGDAGNDRSYQAEISADGQHVVFTSAADDLIADDNNSREDIFLRSRSTGMNLRVSVSSAGGEANIRSEFPSVNGDGTQVAFKSLASNLVDNDLAFNADIFRHSVGPGETLRVSEAPPPGIPSPSSDGPGELPSMSDDANFVVFETTATDLIPSTANEQTQIFLYDVAAQTYLHISQANNGALGDDVSTEADVTNDGKKIIFRSLAENLAGDDDNRSFDVFVYDVDADLLSLVSRDPKGNVISGGTTGAPRITGDGTYALFDYRGTLLPEDTNTDYDVYRLNLETDELVRVSVAADGGDPDGLAIDPDFSEDGRWVVFSSSATNLLSESDVNDARDVFLRDVMMDETVLISRNESGQPVTQDISNPGISGNGRFVSFETRESLLAADTNNNLDVYVFDVETEALSLPGLGQSGDTANAPVNALRYSSNGLYYCFLSSASNLVGGPSVSRGNAFVRDTINGRTQLVSLRLTGESAQDGVRRCQPSNDGQTVVFESDDGLLVQADVNDYGDVFLWRTDVILFDGFQ